MALDIRLLDDEGNEINVGNIEDEDRRFPRSFDAPKKPKKKMKKMMIKKKKKIKKLTLTKNSLPKVKMIS